MKELVDVVNENDQVIGQDFLDEKETKGFISRNVIVFIQDFDGAYVICKRASTKKIDPGLYDASVCGSLEVGEIYIDAAHRELREELGFDCELAELCVFYQEFPGKMGVRKHFTGIFYGRSDHPIQLNHELADYQKMKYDDLEYSIRENPDLFCVGFTQEVRCVSSQLPR